MRARIVKFDELQYEVQVLKEIVSKNDGTTRQEWEGAGYYRSLAFAAERALLKGLPEKAVVTKAEVEDAIKRIAAETKAVLA
jgi:hypothetical protein